MANSALEKSNFWKKQFYKVLSMHYLAGKMLQISDYTLLIGLGCCHYIDLHPRGIVRGDMPARKLADYSLARRSCNGPISFMIFILD